MNIIVKWESWSDNHAIFVKLQNFRKNLCSKLARFAMTTHHETRNKDKLLFVKPGELLNYSCLKYVVFHSLRPELDGIKSCIVFSGISGY